MWKSLVNCPVTRFSHAFPENWVAGGSRNPKIAWIVNGNEGVGTANSNVWQK